MWLGITELIPESVCKSKTGFFRSGPGKRVLGSDVVLDEISFLSKTVGERVIWIRYLAIARRGNPKICVAPLRYRITVGGQGGGGPISLEERHVGWHVG